MGSVAQWEGVTDGGQLLSGTERLLGPGHTELLQLATLPPPPPRRPAQVVESRSRETNPEDASDFGAIRVSALTLVDLAGSERIAKTGGLPPPLLLLLLGWWRGQGGECNVKFEGVPAGFGQRGARAAHHDVGPAPSSKAGAAAHSPRLHQIPLSPPCISLIDHAPACPARRRR